ncbi:MAG TPA: cytochrome P450 [Streptosporangiales bacterium]
MTPCLPEPPGLPVLGHLWHWTTNPLRLLEAGAGAGPVFRLRLWRPAVVGYSPDWNRAVLSDPETFRSQGSLSRLTPYLSAGVVHTDPPDHRPRRRRLNRHFGARALDPLRPRLDLIAAASRPRGIFDARAWAAAVVRRMLDDALFGGGVPDRLLARFLAPLDHALPVPMLPRPLLFHRVDSAIARVLDDPPVDSVAARLAGDPEAVTDLRVALAAGYDTTSHTLAWAAWHLACRPSWRHPDRLQLLIDETLRMYPAGWLGSRVAAHDTTAAGVTLAAGTLVCYSPYLTHRDPALWPEPDAFRPDRFGTGRPDRWTYLPFAAGPRTCLGAQLARLILTAALTPFRGRPPRPLHGCPRPGTGITLTPRGGLVLDAGAA